MNVFTFDAYVAKELAQDELKYSPSGKAYLKTSLPLRKTKQDDPTTWISITMFGKTAEYFSTYHHKGDYIVVSGYVQGRFDKDGKQNGVEVIANSINIMTPSYADKEGHKEQKPTGTKYTAPTVNNISDDDLPF